MSNPGQDDFPSADSTGEPGELGPHSEVVSGGSQDAFKTSGEDWRRIFDSISDPAMILDLDQNILLGNTAAQKTFELPLHRILGRKCYEVLRQSATTACCRLMDSLVESGGAVQIEAEEIETASGVFLVTVSPIFDAEGKLSRVLHIAKDITERHQAESELRLFRTLLDQSTDGIEVLDPETGRFLEVNQTSHVTHGYTKEEFLDLTVFDVDPTVDRADFPKLMERLRQAGSMLWEGSHVRKTGQPFPLK